MVVVLVLGCWWLEVSRPGGHTPLSRPFLYASLRERGWAVRERRLRGVGVGFRVGMVVVGGFPFRRVDRAPSAPVVGFLGCVKGAGISRGTILRTGVTDRVVSRIAM